MENKNNKAPAKNRSNAPANPTDALASLGADLLERATQGQAALGKAWDELLAQWGIAGEPVGIQRLRAMIQEEGGGNPGDNAFTRELIALRADDHS